MTHCLAVSCLLSHSAQGVTEDELLTVSFNDILNLSSENVALLTKTSEKKTPASVTRISQDMIKSSGARELSELIDIYVPNAQVWQHNFGQNHIGFRGLVSDRDTQFLYVINGKTMNHRAKLGAASEVDLPNLQDIQSIKVISGPGSAVYGAGAVSGVIAVTTFDGSKLKGTELSIRQGFRENFTNLGINSAKQFDSGGRLYFHYDITDYNGANQKYAPYVLGRTIYPNEDTTQQPIARVGQPISFANLPNDEASAFGLTRHKLHLQYTHQDWSTWLRLTRGGEAFEPSRGVARTDSSTVYTAFDGDLDWRHQLYQQLTLATQYSHDLTLNSKIQFDASYGSFDIQESKGFEDLFRSDREDEYQLKLLYTNSAEQLSYAYGVELTHLRFGLEPYRFSEYVQEEFTPIDDNNPLDNSPWSANVFSLLGELNYELNNKFSLFSSIRGDIHTYTQAYWSPRLALVYSVTPNNLFKLIFNHSNRRANDADLRHGFLTDSTAKNEAIDSIELRYDQYLNTNSHYYAALFIQDAEISSWNTRSLRTFNIGDYQAYGVEFAYDYTTVKHRFLLSYGYVNQIDFNLGPDGVGQSFSAQPYGFGDDIASWWQHSFKLAYSFDYTQKSSFDISLRYLAGLQGLKDLAAYYNTDQFEEEALKRGVARGYDKAFRPSAFVNLGTSYMVNDSITLRLEGQNILGLLDKNLNKRNFLAGRGADYRAEAAAITLGVQIKIP